MKPRITTRAAVLAASLFAAGCGSDGPAPTTASPSPFVAQVGGVWSGTQTLTSTDGGHCVPVLLRVGMVEPMSLSVRQDDVELTARMASPGTGIACNYSGRASLNSLVLDSSDCDKQLLVVQCQDGIIRDLKLVGSTISATLRGGVATGTVAYTYNMFVTGKIEGAGSVLARYDYTATRR
jgi:hypothetical protein